MIFERFLDLFRQAAPYIHTHRNKTFVIHYDADFEHVNLQKSLHDCALLQSLGIKIILVNGIRQEIDRQLKKYNIKSDFYADKRVTTEEILPFVLSAAGTTHLKIEATLSMGMINSPMQDAAVKVASGNFITAKPIGVIKGVDYAYTGVVRKINAAAIAKHLAIGEIVLVSPIGYALNGDSYNLNSEEVASEIAIAMKADKLIYISNGVNAYIKSGQHRQLTPQQAKSADDDDVWLNKRLTSAAEACIRGIRRVHLIERDDVDSLLLELFTRDGVGIMVTSDQYDRMRPATLDDINSIVNLISPLEDQGILIKRDRELLNKDIHHFYLLTRDSTIIACAALYIYEKESMAELACLAVDPSYRQHRRADHLLSELERLAIAKGVGSLFILTTQTAQWFEERGFFSIGIDKLPAKKQATYNHQRKSKAYLKKLV